MISPTVYTPIRCALCGGDRFAHNRVNGECRTFERAEHRPYVLRRRVQAPVVEWRVRQA